jgi:predicted RND superfamily exporter protein
LPVFIHLLRFSVRRPRLVVALVGAVTLCALWFAPQIRLRLDGRSLIPTGLPEFADADGAAALFGLRDLVVIGVGNEESGVYTAETLARVARLSEGLSLVEGVVAGSVTSLSTLPRASLADGKLDMPTLLRRGAEPTAEEILQLRREVVRAGHNTGTLVSADGKATAIVARVEPGADRYRLLKEARALVAGESGGRDEVYLSGSALAQAVLGEATGRDLVRLIPTVILVLSVMLFASFRHPAPALLSLTEIGVSLIWMAGLMGLTGQPVFVTTLVLPVILIAVGVSDDVYALGNYFHEAVRAGDGAEAERVVIAAFGAASRPVAMTAVSTLVGLLSMATTSLNPLRVFGLFGSAAILFSTLFTFTLLPALLVLLKPRVRAGAGWRAVHGGRALNGAVRWLTERVGPRWVLACALVVAVCAGLAAARLRVDDSWVRNLPAASDIVRGDKFFNEKLAGTTTVELMLEAKREGWFASVEGLRALGSLEWTLARVAHVGAVDCLFNDVVRVNSAFGGVNYGAYREALRTGRLPLGEEEAGQALEGLSVARPAAMRERVDEEYRRARVTVFVRNADYARIDAVLRAAEREASARGGGYGVVPFGDGLVSYLTVRLLVEGQVRSIVLALLTDLLLLTLLLRSARAALIAILPVVFSVLFVFAALGATGTPLGIANSMFAGIALGIGLDFSIHLTTAYKQRIDRGVAAGQALRQTLEVTGPAVCVSAASITAGFSVLTLSAIAPNVQLGAMICLCLLTCASATLLLIPSLLRLRWIQD